MDRRSGVSPRGKSIRISFQFKGIKCRETIKLEPTKSNLKHAERLKSEIDRKIALGTFKYRDYFPDSKSKYADVFTGPSSNVTVAAQLERYLAAKKHEISASTYATYTDAVKAHLIPAFGNKMLRSLTTMEIREWIGSLDTSKKYINNLLTPLRGMYADAYADELIDRNPLDRIKNLKNKTREPDPFTPDEQRRLINALRYEQDANLIQFAFWTGLRPSEVIELEWGDVDMEKQTVRISRSRCRGDLKDPKTAAGTRTVDLLSPAIRALQNQKIHTFMAGNTIFLNQRTGRAWDTDKQIWRILWQPAIKKADLRYREPRQTRHTYASMMLTAGEDLAWLANQMGHTSIGLLQKKYARWIPDHNTNAGRKAEAMFGENSIQKGPFTAHKKTGAI